MDGLQVRIKKIASGRIHNEANQEQTGESDENLTKHFTSTEHVD